jgi:hypothetical protein
VIEIGIAWLWLGGELLLMLAVALLVLLIRAARRRRRDRRAAMHLVGVVKAAVAGRRAETRALLEEPYGYSGEALAETLDTIMGAETQLYQRVISMYLRRDAAALRKLHGDVEALSAPLRGLQVPAGARAAGGGAGPSADEEVARVRAENESLQQELQITMETMSRMLSEYSSMIGGGPETVDQADTLKGMLASATGAAPVPEAAAPPEGSGGGLGDLGELEELTGLGGLDADMAWDGAARGAEHSRDTGADQAPDQGHDEWDLTRGMPIDLSDGVLAEVQPPEGGTAGRDKDAELDDVWAAALEEQETTEKSAGR